MIHPCTLLYRHTVYSNNLELLKNYSASGIERHSKLKTYRSKHSPYAMNSLLYTEHEQSEQFSKNTDYILL